MIYMYEWMQLYLYASDVKVAATKWAVWNQKSGGERRRRWGVVVLSSKQLLHTETLFWSFFQTFRHLAIIYMAGQPADTKNERRGAGDIGI